MTIAKALVAPGRALGVPGAVATKGQQLSLLSRTTWVME